MTGSGRSIKERIKLIAKKPKTAIYTLVAVLLITAIAVGCTFTGAKDDNPWTWASGINPNTLYSATVWSGGDDTSLSDNECQELSHIIRGLSRGSFTENTQFVGSTPTYGIVIETSSGVYNINESIASDSALEMKYADKQWWIDSDELTEFICQHIFNVGTDIDISVEVDTDIPTAVIDYAMDYTETQLSYYTGELGYDIKEAKIVGLTQINTGTAVLDHSINMYLLEYRFLPAYPDEVMLVGGMKMEDGYITQWGSTGQPYLLLLHDENDDWTRICTTNTDIIEQEYGTPEMLAQYGNAYTAAAMELYARYLSTYTLNDVTIVLEPGFTIREKGYRCFINDDGVMVGVELLDKDSDRLVDFAPGYDEKFDPFSLPTDGYGNHYRDFVFEGEYHYIVYREFEPGIVIVELMCPEHEGYSESLNESYKSKFPVWAASAGPTGQSTDDAAAPSKLIIDLLNSAGAYTTAALDALLDNLMDNPAETFEAIGARYPAIQDWICWSLAEHMDGMALDTGGALSVEGLSKNGLFARDLLWKYMSGNYDAPPSWRQVYMRFWTDELPGLFDGIEIDGVGLIDFDSDGVPELAVLQKDGSAVVYYTDGERTYHNLGNVYDTSELDFSGSVLSIFAGNALDGESVNALLNAWRPVS